MTKVTVNGRERSLESDSVLGLIAELGLPGPLLLIELNGVALRRAEWAEKPLGDGDKVEILSISAGG